MVNYKLFSVTLTIITVVFVGAFAYAYQSYSNETSLYNHEAASANQLSSEKQALQDQLNGAEANLTATVEQRNQLLAQVQADKGNITLLTAKVSNQDSQIASLNTSIATMTAQIGNLSSITDLKQSVLVLAPTKYVESSFNGGSQNAQYASVSTSATCCFVQYKNGTASFTYSGFLNITLLSTNSSAPGKPQVSMNVIFVSVRGIQEATTIYFNSTAPAKCADCLTPRHSLIIPVYSGLDVPTILFVNFEPVAVSETVQVIYQY